MGQGLFSLVLAFGALLIVIALVPEMDGAIGLEHPDYPTMRAGGSAERHQPVLWLGSALGCLLILLLVALIAFGARQRGRLRGLGRPLLIAGAGYLAVWTAVVLTYRYVAGLEDAELFLALPAPTALMLYLLGPAPIAFSLFFVLGFKRWVFSDEDFAKYQRLLDEKPRAADAPEGSTDGEAS